MRKITVYAKLIGIGLLVLFIVHFTWSNNQPVTIKFFWKEIFKEVPMFYVILGSASTGILIFAIARKIRKLLADVKQLHREEKDRQKLVTKIKSEVEKESNSQS